MILVWVVLAVVIVVALASAVVVTTRRRRAPRPEGRPRTAAPGGPPPRPAPPGPPPPPPGPPPPPPGKAPAGPAPGAPAPPAPAEAPAEALGPPPTFRDRLGKARGTFAGVLGAVRARDKVDPAIWGELEEMLIRGDVGVATTTHLLDGLRQRVRAHEITGGTALVDALRADLRDLLGSSDRDLHLAGEQGVVSVWLFVGVNGVGKTTTVGKLARREAAGGRTVLLAAGDTFRAAAAEQLSLWADRAGVEVVRGAEGGDPSAVVFDAVQRAAARGREVVLADTAGRLHTRVNLVEELKKIRRVADRPPGRVTEVLLVLDATTGQNGLVQAREFTDAVAVTGLVLTKLDGTAKGGVVFSVQHQLGVPVKLVGLGEGIDDLVPFDPDAFVEALFA